jgi:hypothetical protein
MIAIIKADEVKAHRKAGKEPRNTFALVAAAGICLAFGPSSSRLTAQTGRPGAELSAAPRAIAPVDFSGQWVSVVTEDWRFRMVLPPKGDYAGVPLSASGRKAADSWDPAKDERANEQCKAYGAPAIMRAPGHIRISWADEDTLEIQTDAGTQTRLFYFKEPKAKGGDWQGVSRASWMPAGSPMPTGSRAGNSENPLQPTTLKVVTTKLRSGYLRKNGVPYSDNAILTEYYDRTTEPDGTSYLIVTAVVEDPTYLNQEFITSSHFRKQDNTSGWMPIPCLTR